MKSLILYFSILRYIYIENQYFQGSAYAWDDDKGTKAHHVIPMELAHRIVEKIHAGERFAVYVVIPMYPEGDPASGAVQEMLYWQHKTVSMMYSRIGKGGYRVSTKEDMMIHGKDRGKIQGVDSDMI